MRQERRIVGQQDVMLQLADIEDDEGAETLPHDRANGLDQRRSLLNGRRDQIGGMGGGDIAGGEIFRAAGQMQAEKWQRPVDMQTTVFADIAANGLAGLEAGYDVIDQIGDGKRGAAGGEEVHRRDLRHSSSTGWSAAIAWRISATTRASGFPVHSSMKNFLNSTAMAQPFSANLSWMKRVCSPLP
jgi:hypothetical protein